VNFVPFVVIILPAMERGGHTVTGGEERERRDTRPLWHDWPLWVGVLLVAGVAGGAVLTLQEPIRAFFASGQEIAALVQQAGVWGPLIVIGLELAQAIVAPIPGVAVELASGYLFGPVWGTLYCAIGVFSGMAITLILARRFGRPLAERLVPRRQLDRLDVLAKKRGAFFFFMIYLLPFLPDDAASLAAGLSPLPLSLLFAIGVIGRLPGMAVANLVGARGHTIGPWGWAVGAAAVCLLALVSWRYQERLEGALLDWIHRLTGRKPLPYPAREDRERPEQP